MYFMLQKLTLSLIALLVVIAAGCSNETVQQQYVIDQKRVADGNDFAEYQRITDQEQVTVVRELLKETQWDQDRVVMSRPPDYHFAIVLKNFDKEDQPVVYRM
jgi:hypothetical protein